MSGTAPRRKVTKPVDLRLVKQFNGLFLPLKMGTQTIRFLVDTGAPWTLMSQEKVEECGLIDSMSEIHEGGMVTIGKLKAKAEAEGGYLLCFVVAVMDHLYTPLLGMNFLLRYGCLLVLDPELPLVTVRPARRNKMGQFCFVFKKCLVSSNPVTAILDTGSTHCFISKALAKEFKLKRKFCWPRLVILFDGSIIATCRKVRQAEVNIDGLRFSTDLIIDPSKRLPLILGMNILSGSTMCLEKKEILLGNANPLCVEGEQDPKPSSISFMPPEFSILQTSDRLVISATERKQCFSPFNKVFKFLTRFRKPVSGRYGRSEETSGCWLNKGRVKQTKGEGGAGTGCETGEKQGNNNNQGNSSDK